MKNSCHYKQTDFCGSYLLWELRRQMFLRFRFRVRTDVA